MGEGTLRPIAKAGHDKLTARRVCYLLALYNLFIHLLLLVYDLLHPDVWLNWDRAGQRLNAIKAALQSTDSLDTMSETLLSQGIIGDYLFQAIPYAMAGPVGVIVFQILLSIFSVVAIFEISLIISKRIGFAACATLIYLHLPHTLTAPHFLASEAIFVPLIVFSFQYLFRFAESGENPRNLWIAGIFLGLASIVRPITIPWGIAAYVLCVAINKGRQQKIWAVFVLISLLPASAWMGLQFIGTGHPSLGEASHDMGHNLAKRTERMAWTLPDKERAEAFERYFDETDDEGRVVNRGALSLSEYLEFSANHPLAFFQHLGRDAVVFVGKSGGTRLAFDYFEIFPADRVERLQFTWHQNWERNGLTSTIRELFDEEPALMTISFVLAAFCVLFFSVSMTFGAYGALRDAWSRKTDYRVATLMLVAFPFYVFGASQVVTAMQSRHRAPAEFALSILFVFGLMVLWKLKLRWQDSRRASLH